MTGDLVTWRGVMTWRGVTYDKRCLDARFLGGHSRNCPKCATRGCCGHCIADGLRTLAEIDSLDTTED